MTLKNHTSLSPGQLVCLVKDEMIPLYRAYLAAHPAEVMAGRAGYNQFWKYKEANPNLVGIYGEVPDTVGTSLKWLRAESVTVFAGSSSQVVHQAERSKQRRMGVDEQGGIQEVHEVTIYSYQIDL